MAKFIPTSNYHPATKKYVDDLAAVAEGTIDFATKQSNVITYDVRFFKRQGKVVSLDMDVEIDGNATNWSKLGVVSILPAVQKYGTVYHRSSDTTVNIGYVRIDVDGGLYISLNTINVVHAFEIVYFSA